MKKTQEQITYTYAAKTFPQGLRVFPRFLPAINSRQRWAAFPQDGSLRANHSSRIPCSKLSCEKNTCRKNVPVRSLRLAEVSIIDFNSFPPESPYSEKYSIWWLQARPWLQDSVIPLVAVQGRDPIRTFYLQISLAAKTFPQGLCVCRFQFVPATSHLTARNTRQVFGFKLVLGSKITWSPIEHVPCNFLLAAKTFP